MHCVATRSVISYTAILRALVLLDVVLLLEEVPFDLRVLQLLEVSLCVGGQYPLLLSADSYLISRSC